MRFLHLSNVGLFDTQTENRFGIDFPVEHLEAFQTVLHRAQKEEVDMVFITGNLFAVPPTNDMLSEIDAMFGQLPNTRFYILTGKKDASRETEPYATYEWKSNTVVFYGDCIQRVFVRKYNLEVTGIGYAPATWNKVLLEKITAGKKGKLQVLLLPGLRSNCTEEELRTLKTSFHYVALGDETVTLGDKAEKLYSPGSFTPTEFSNQFEHGYIDGELETGNVLKTHFVPGTNREYVPLRVTTDESMDFESIEFEIQKTINQYGSQNLYRITFTGDTNPELYFGKEKLFELGNIVDIEDNTDRAEAIQKLLNEHKGDALGRFIRDMLPDDNQEIRRKAMKYGIEALLTTRGKE